MCLVMFMSPVLKGLPIQLWLFCALSLFTLFYTVIRAENNLSLDGIINKLGDTEYVYQVPGAASLNNPAAAVSAVLFLAHGCSHSATDWWPPTPSCPTCIGLPVEMSIVQKALRRNMLVVAVSSFDRSHKCWSSPDIQAVTNVLAALYQQHFQFDTTPTDPTASQSSIAPPLFMLGASSGGSFVGTLSQTKTLREAGLRAAAICVQISALRTVSDHLPPTVFTLMSRDRRTMRLVESRLLAGNSGGGGGGGLPSPSLLQRVEEQAVSPSFMLDHGGVSSVESSVAIHTALLQAGLIHSRSHMLKDDPRTTDWRVVSLNAEYFGAAWLHVYALAMLCCLHCALLYDLTCLIIPLLGC